MKLMVKTIIAWTLVLSLLTGAAASGYSTVLCIGEDGQAELESICMPCCSEEEEEKCTVEDLDAKHDDHDGEAECSDVEIEYTFIGKRTHKIQAPILTKSDNLFTSSVIENDLIDSNESIEKNNNSIPPLINFNLSKLTTVILTC